jgi:hypothetical protein
MSNSGERLRAIGVGFDMASIKSYLISDYNSSRLGKALSNLWMTSIPRMLCPQNPVIIHPGGQLNVRYFNDPRQVISAMAPIYSAEAYGSCSTFGVRLISVLVGLAIGWGARLPSLAVSGARPEYPFIALPIPTWACFLESWLVPGYLREFEIHVVILMIARIRRKCHSNPKKKKA